MSAPFYATVDYSQYDETVVDIYNPGSGWQTVEPPFNPFFICRPNTSQSIQAHLSGDVVGVTQTTGKPLSAVSEPAETLQAVSVSHPITISKLNDSEYEESLMNNKIPFIQNISMVAPDWWDQYSYDPKDIDVVVVDIEQSTDGEFPLKSDPVISVAAQYNDDEPIVWIGEDSPSRFLSWLNERNVDMIITYFGDQYDLPVLSEHADFSQYWYLEWDGRENAEIAKPTRGLILYDLMASVSRDQTLSGIKSRGLKNVVQWKKDQGELPEELKVIQVDRMDIDNLSEDELRTYNKNDVIITKALFDVYFEQLHYLSEFLNLPLNQMFPIHDSLPGKIITGRILWNQHIYMDSTNRQRFPEIFKRQEVVNGDKKPFEGASVGIQRFGRFSPVYHLDISSLYPTILLSLGIGPDNCYISEFRDNRIPPEGTYVTRLGSGQFAIWDDQLEKSIIISVDGQSEYAAYLRRLYDDRIRLKTDPEKSTICNGYKVILNSVYGLNGSKTTRYGSAPVAILITAVGRSVLERTINDNSSSVIEYDTDGIYFKDKIDPEELEKETNGYVVNQLKGEPLFKWDKEVYEAGLFYKAKNYLLLDSSNNVRRKGVSMKGSHHPPFFEEILLDLGEEILQNGYTAEIYEKAREYSNLDFELDKFVRQRAMGKHPDEYKSTSGLSYQLAEQYKDAYGQFPDLGYTMQFVVAVVNGVKGQYVLKSQFDPDTMRLDKDWYRSSYDKILDRLDIKLHQQKSLFDYG